MSYFQYNDGMATDSEITQYKAMVPADGITLTDQEIGALIDSVGIYEAAARRWDQYAATSASYVNISESGSSRNMGDIHKQAMGYAGYLRGLKGPVANGPLSKGMARIKKLTREGGF